MNIFCQECGTQAVSGDLRCRNCGHQLSEPEQPTRAISQKKAPMPKKQKVILGVIILLTALFLVLYLFGKNYYSLSSVEKRFETALIKKDADAIQKLGIHENNTAITEAESQAFLGLLDLEGRGYVQSFTSVQPYGKAFGVFDQYKIEFTNQFIYSTDYGKDVVVSLGKQPLNIHTNEENQVVYGPLIPGIYTFKAAYENDFGQADFEQEMRLESGYGDRAQLQFDEIDFVDVYFDHEVLIDEKQSHIVVNKKEIPFNEDGKASFGPLLLDASLTGQVITTYPWGNVTSKEFKIDSYELEVGNKVFSDKHYKDIKQLIADFGEELAESYASKSTKGYKTASNEVKQKMEERIEYSYGEYPLAIQLDTIGIAKDSATYYAEDGKKGIQIVVEYLVQMGDAGESELYERDWQMELQLVYNEKDKKWLIDDVDSDYYSGYYGDFDSFAGSKKRYTTGKQVVKEPEKENDADSEEEFKAVVETFMESANTGHVLAINDQDFSQYEYFTSSNGARREEARKYIASLADRGITQEHVSTVVEKIDKVDASTFTVTTKEKYIIYKDGTGEEKTFRTVNTVKLMDEELYIHKLESTKQI